MMDVDYLLKTYIALPPALRNTYPWGMGNRFVTVVWEKVLPLLGFRWVSVTKPDDYDRPYYRFVFWTPFRKHVLNCTPKSVHTLWQIALNIRKHKDYKYVLGLDNSNPHEGECYLPKWAIDRFIELADAIVQEEQPLIAKAMADAEVYFKERDKPTLH